MWSVTSDRTTRTTRSPFSTVSRTIPPFGAPSTTTMRIRSGRAEAAASSPSWSWWSSWFGSRCGLRRRAGRLAVVAAARREHEAGTEEHEHRAETGESATVAHVRERSQRCRRGPWLPRAARHERRVPSEPRTASRGKGAAIALAHRRVRRPRSPARSRGGPGEPVLGPEPQGPPREWDRPRRGDPLARATRRERVVTVDRGPRRTSTPSRA